ncbi:hypothetical protein GOZ89_25245 [Agrobacterium vitis]|uniref:ParB N-terminal domain-containing protein n=1 Tax=Agrobacterium vitis TaxID=373 RepID=UPI0009BF1B01|nr:hypothetical protein [Agrobacterium vitis]MCM2453738.1 ParB N-terminal domain-containing protein [Agrobacterium vitis]MUO73498.1 hypothetical protein [Agrobacterium vitis]MUO87665.1 hypothetical protein [Agrobacterium vitis]MVA36886.1 hypothetical protein [Agrobacterium vitis]
MEDSRVEFLNISKLLPTEEHIKRKADELHAKIESEGFWTHPILVLEREYVVLDGHHRCAAAALLGLTVVPSLLVSSTSPRLKLECWRDGEAVTIEEVVSRGISGDLFPPKTTKFSLLGEAPKLMVSLRELAR